MYKKLKTRKEFLSMQPLTPRSATYRLAATAGLWRYLLKAKNTEP